jgi:hypothetical protein
MMRYCKHVAVIDGEHSSYTGPVYASPVTGMNRAAHGGVTYSQTCTECKSVRMINQNGRHFEFGIWISPRDYCR